MRAWINHKEPSDTFAANTWQELGELTASQSGMGSPLISPWQHQPVRDKRSLARKKILLDYVKAEGKSEMEEKEDEAKEKQQ